MESNTSGHGVATVLPREIDRWNWGAFLLNWVWGLGNNTVIALVMFVPIVNMVMPFVLGAKGSAWAWRNKRWETLDHFKRVQRLWAIWGVVAWIILLAVIAASWFGVTALFKHSELSPDCRPMPKRSACSAHRSRAEARPAAFKHRDRPEERNWPSRWKVPKAEARSICARPRISVSGRLIVSNCRSRAGRAESIWARATA
jgi:hypothetical protein